MGLHSEVIGTSGALPSPRSQAPPSATSETNTMNRTEQISAPTGPLQAAGAILAGGQATRMGGRPKSFLEVGGRRIIDRQLEVMRPLFRELILCTNDPPRYADLGLPMVSDDVRGPG